MAIDAHVRTQPATLAECVVVRGDALMLEDVVDLSGLPQDLRAAARRVQLVRFGSGPFPSTIDREPLLARARALVPALRFYLSTPHGGVVRLVRGDKPQRARSEGTCLAAVRDIGVGEPVHSAAFVNAACTPAVQNVFVYEPATQTVRTARAIAKGALVVRYPDLERQRIAAGDPLTFAVRAGTARIERRVEALQSVRSGSRLFVRSLDGKVFVASADEVAK